MLIARGGRSPTALLLGVETSHYANALAAAPRDRFRPKAAAPPQVAIRAPSGMQLCAAAHNCLYVQHPIMYNGL
jgi:hypothetical protein